MGPTLRLVPSLGFNIKRHQSNLTGLEALPHGCCLRRDAVVVIISALFNVQLLVWAKKTFHGSQHVNTLVV